MQVRRAAHGLSFGLDHILVMMMSYRFAVCGITVLTGFVMG